MKKLFILLILAVLHSQTKAQYWQAANTCGRHIVALQNGTIWAWEYNYYGQLGDGTLINKNTP